MKAKKSKSKNIISEEDLKSYSVNEILTESYGARGTAKRKIAELRIAELSKNIVRNNTLKEIREERNKSQHQVAGVMKVDDSVVSKLEKNFEKAQINTILRYAKALKAKSIELIFTFGENHQHVLQLRP